MKFETIIAGLIWEALERQKTASRGLAGELSAASHPTRKTMGPSSGWGAAAEGDAGAAETQNENKGSCIFEANYVTGSVLCRLERCW